jgi:ORF6
LHIPKGDYITERRIMNELTVTEYKNVRVLTTQQIAEAYEADVKVISNNFNRNKERYIEGKHFICLEGEELKIFKTNHHFDESSRINKLYLWTEKGAFLHAKSLNTDKAWEVYDRLVDEYFDKGSRKPLTVAEQIQLLAQGTADHEERIEKLENTMTIDYGQQKYLGDLVSIVVIEVLGGKNSNAYSEIGKKVFAECNRDVKSYFGVNARNNIPKLRYEEAVKYIKGWQPCTNTKMQIRDCNYDINSERK